MRFITTFIKEAFEAIFPSRCEVCGESLVDGEEILCLHCLHSLPRTYCHRDSFGIVHQRVALPGLPIDKGAAFFHYIKENPYAKLLQKGKYNSRPEICEHLGLLYANELNAEQFFDGIDMLIPLPLHWTKRLRRGYNQSEMICRGVSRATGIAIGDNLTAKRHSTQTRKTASERQANVRGVFQVNHPEELEGKHILLVDDIITTGSTIIAAATAIRSAAPTARISLLTLGCTKL